MGHVALRASQRSMQARWNRWLHRRQRCTDPAAYSSRQMAQRTSPSQALLAPPTTAVGIWLMAVMVAPVQVAPR